MLSEPGGTVAVGIPDYRMPRPLLQREADIIAALGVEIEYGVKLGRDVTLPQLKEQYDAVFLGTGAFKSKPMGVEGEDQGYEGFSAGGIHYLRMVALGEPIVTPKRVIVVGGGNTAIDCVRVALREGAEESILLYRRTRKEMPAEPYEVDDAEEEGVKFMFLALPTKLITENNKIVGVEVLKMELGEPDASGRRSPQPIAGSEYVIPCDLVIPAIGQDPDLDYLEQGDYGIKKTRWNSIVTNGGTMMTDNEGVFAGGDCEYGAMTVVVAVGHGRRAARTMHRYLTEGQGLPQRRGRHGGHHQQPRRLRQERESRHRRRPASRTPAEDSRCGAHRQLRRDRTGHAGEPGGARSGTLPALLPRRHAGRQRIIRQLYEQLTEGRFR